MKKKTGSFCTPVLIASHLMTNMRKQEASLWRAGLVSRLFTEFMPWLVRSVWISTVNPGVGDLQVKFGYKMVTIIRMTMIYNDHNN